jgi:hypothetical protein
MSDLDLFNTFIDLHEKLSGRGISTILGGGLGLYLKQLHLMESPVRTLIDASGWPQPRSTSDIDVFFPLEVLVSLDEMKAVRSIIDEMHFEAISGSEYWRFNLPQNEVKIDLLTGPIDDTVKNQLKSDSRRARPKGDLQLHAHPVPEVRFPGARGPRLRSKVDPTQRQRMKLKRKRKAIQATSQCSQ